MKLLLVSPRFPPTYWGFQYGLPLTGKRVSLPPLGLLTLAALLPGDVEVRLVDTNARPLRNEEVEWADAVLVGGMRIQAASIHDILARARSCGRRTVVGGPAPTSSPREFLDADLVFRGEAEGRIDELMTALRAPAVRQRVFDAPATRPDLTSLPVPRYDLVDPTDYASMSLQYSRGCPYRCEFCDIIEIYGRVPRVKTDEQVLAELDAIRDTGFRGSVFFVDDNFIGNKPAVKRLLPRVAEWQQSNGYAFEMYTEASVNLAADEDLVRSMVSAGFSSVFLGIETPSATALASARKKQNLKVDLQRAVRALTEAGLEVFGGFIVGFDGDDESAFDIQRQFISTSPIPLAMVGVLTALPETSLWRRLEHEGRLRNTSCGDQFGRPNFETRLDEEVLLRRYGELMEFLYSPEQYFRRCEAFVELARKVPGRRRADPRDLAIVARTMLEAGTRSPWRHHFWRFLARTLARAPHVFPWAVAHSVMGVHLIRYTQEQVLPRIERALADVRSDRERRSLGAGDAPRTWTVATEQEAPRAGRSLPVVTQ